LLKKVQTHKGTNNNIARRFISKQGAGLCCEIKVYPEMEHTFPDDFDDVLLDILYYLQEE
jgi:hypothetical protein